MSHTVFASVSRTSCRVHRHGGAAERPAISVQDLTVRFGSVTALRSISVQIPARRLTAILGLPGCGKTTLLKALSCELPAGSGNVLIQEVPARLWPEKKRSACVFSSVGRQCTDCAFWLSGECALDSRAGVPTPPGLLEALDLLGLRHLGNRACSSLSPRDMSRLVLAATLAPLLAGRASNGSAHLWLDDPLDGLDSLHAHRLMHWLHETARERQTTVVTLTDHGRARSYADHTILLREARLIAAGAPANALTSSNLTATFGDLN